MTSYTGCDALLHCTSHFGASFLSLPPSSRAAHRCTPWSTCQGCRWPCATAPAFTPLSWRTRAICSRACARASTRTGPISTCVHTRGRTTRAHAPASLRDMREGRHGCALARVQMRTLCAFARVVRAARCVCTPRAASSLHPRAHQGVLRDLLAALTRTHLLQTVAFLVHASAEPRGRLRRRAGALPDRKLLHARARQRAHPDHHGRGAGGCAGEQCRGQG
jgi:hypothetical protein